MRKLLAVLFSALALTACSGGGSGPDAVVQDFIKAVDKKETDKAVAHFSLDGVGSEEADMVSGKLKMMMGEMAKQFERNNGVDKVEVKTSTLDEAKTTAKVTVNVAYKNGKNEDMPFTLKKEKDGWKIVLK